jgi:hypothetical protein
VADARHTRVTIQQQPIGIPAARDKLHSPFLGVGDHRPELQDRERPSPAADARLTEEHRTERVETDGDRGDADHRPEHTEEKPRAQHVE